MHSCIMSCGLEGIEGYLLEIEIDVALGTLPGFDIVGLPDTSVRESRERVRSAIKNSGYKFINRRITVNLAPGDRKKEGPLYDLAIAVGLTSAMHDISLEKFAGSMFFGELALDGRIRPVNGILPLIIAGKKAGLCAAIVPVENAGEAALVKGMNIYACNTLSDVLAIISGEQSAESFIFTSEEQCGTPKTTDIDFADVKGQELAKRAFEISAAGMHNLAMTGPPGTGKTMLARRLPGIMPPLSEEEMLEVTKLYSIAGLTEGKLLHARPFRAPHHTVTVAGMIGGMSNPKPGEASLAHNGILFLDEMPEFKRQVLEVLRQPMEEGLVSLARGGRRLVFPARFMLIAASNPCPCGFLHDPVHPCTCRPQDISRYKSRISGPLSDRIDMQIEIGRNGFDDIGQSIPKGRSTAEMKAVVERAQILQKIRYTDERFSYNSQIPSGKLERYCQLDASTGTLLRDAFKRFGMSMRSHDRVLKLARTIADIDGNQQIGANHIAEAIGYRRMEIEA